MPSLSIGEDGSIGRTKFETSAASFTNWQAGENELILAIRNPNQEAPMNSGGFAFRMAVTTTPVPEPSTFLLAALALPILVRGYRRRA